MHEADIFSDVVRGMIHDETDGVRWNRGAACRAPRFHCARGIAFVLALLALVVERPSASAQDSGVNREYAIKAAYLYNFAKYVEWPKDYVLVAKNDEPVFVIGIVGDDPFGDALATIAKEKKVGDLPIVILPITKREDSLHCHMIFFPKGQPRELSKAVLERAKDDPILLVGESDDFIKSGGLINFFVEENKVRFEVDKDSAANAKFKISSKLLSIGREAR